MNVEILDAPLHFRLHGTSAVVVNERYGETGLRLMDEMWKAIKQTGAANAGINHWVYLADGRMFVGVELLPNAQAPAGLESLEFNLQRCLKHVHVGPYQDLPAKWQTLKEELGRRGETIGAPSLEVYGHHCDDPAKAETTILIGLQG